MPRIFRPGADRTPSTTYRNPGWDGGPGCGVSPMNLQSSIASHCTSPTFDRKLSSNSPTPRSQASISSGMALGVGVPLMSYLVSICWRLWCYLSRTLSSIKQDAKTASAVFMQTYSQGPSALCPAPSLAVSSCSIQGYTLFHSLSRQVTTLLDRCLKLRVWTAQSEPIILDPRLSRKGEFRYIEHILSEST